MRHLHCNKVIGKIIRLVHNYLFRRDGQSDGEQWPLDRLNVGRFHVSTQVFTDLGDTVLLDSLELVKTINLGVNCPNITLYVSTQHYDVVRFNLEFALD
ncbi:hypothetical protein D3C77_612030 [compost metagenome]